jgi:Uncharacterized conserved protein (some members contain a von Willebrand factor type A (vWA) domain)
MTTNAAPNRRLQQTRIAIRELGRAVMQGVAALGRLLSPGWNAVAGVLGPALRVVSALGWLLLAGAVASFAVAALLGWAEFTFIGVTLLAAFVIALGFVFGRATYAVTIELNPRRVVAGDRAMGQLVVANSGVRAVLPTRIELPVGGGMAEFMVPRLAPGAENDELFVVPTAHRAVIVAGPAVSVRGDQLGLLRRTTRWTDPIELFVHPRTTRLNASARGLVRDLEGQPTKVITDSDLAFHALRPYEPGDDIRNVHWRTSARTGQLMIRQYQETRRSQLLLLFSAESARYSSDDEFELGVSVTASIACQVIREETDLNVLWEGGVLRSRTPLSLLDDSCRVQPVSGRYPSLREFARVAGRRLPAPSLVILVVGSAVSTHDIRSVSTLYESDAELIAVRVEDGRDARLDMLGNVMLATVGKLSDLPALLERAGR